MKKLRRMCKTERKNRKKDTYTQMSERAHAREPTSSKTVAWKQTCQHTHAHAYAQEKHIHPHNTRRNYTNDKFIKKKKNQNV